MMMSFIVFVSVSAISCIPDNFYGWSRNRDSAARNRLHKSQHFGEHHPSQAYANQMRRRLQSDTTSQHVHRVGAPYRRGILQPGAI